MGVLSIIGICYIGAMVLLWLGRGHFSGLSRKVTGFLALLLCVTGSGALLTAVLPSGNFYGTTVNRLTDLPAAPRSESTLINRLADLPDAPRSENAPAPAPEQYVSVRRSGPEIAFTFDDGPYPPYTDRLLDVLREKQAHGTFFVVADQAEKHPELIRRMIKEGHTVGLHAYEHRDFLRLTEAEQVRDLQTGKAIIKAITGREPVYWRPPHGFRDFTAMQAAKRQGLTVVNWSLVPRDWTGIGSQEIYRRVREKAGDGDIVLLHDGDSPYGIASRQPTVEAVALLIDSLRAAGYDLVSLDEGNRNRL